MEPTESTIRFYTAPSELPRLGWEEVARRLTEAGLYWVVPRSAGHPHPRPVWGLWLDDEVVLSIGSPPIRAALATDPTVTVHLESATEVVVVEGLVVGGRDDPAALAAYDAKYDWAYEAERYGPLTRVAPQTVLAWTTAGWAGRESFQQVGRWTWPDP